jgi:WD40 repeat protein
MFAFAWSPNGKMIAGASFHGDAHIWDAASGRLLCHIPDAHQGETRCIAWSPDSRQFATCGSDRLIKIWGVNGGKLLHTFNEHADRLGAVCWSPDGRWFASADWRRNLKIRATDTWQIQWDIYQEGSGTGGDHTIAWSPDSHRLATVVGSGKIALWKLLDAKNINKLWTVEAHTSNIRSIAWSVDGSRIASGSEDATVKVWDAETGRELLTLDGHKHLVMSVAWSPDSRRLASADDLSLRIWDATDAYESQDAIAGSRRFNALKVHEKAEQTLRIESEEKSRTVNGGSNEGARARKSD